MAVIDHIDAENRLVYLSATTVDITVQPIDIYREMRILRKTDEALRKYDLFMTMKGAEKKNPDGSKRTERYLVLLDGTLIVPYDTSHIITIDGTMITDSGLEGVQCFNRANLSVSVEVDINYVPKQVEVITIETGGGGVLTQETGGLTQEEHDVLILTKYQNKAVYLDPEALVNGDGSATSPFDNPNDAKDFAEANGINTIYIYSDTIIPGNVKNFTVIGIGNPVIECNGQDLKNTEFFGCELRGTYTDSIKASKCILGDNFELNGGFQNCSIMNNITAIDGGAFTLYKCFSNILNDGVTNLSFNGTGSSKGTVVDFDGDINISDVNNINDLLKISMETNKLTLESTCTLGNIKISGTPLLTRNDNGSIVDTTAMTPNVMLDFDAECPT